MLSIERAISEHAAAAPHRQALVMGGAECDYAGLWQMVNRAAAWFSRNCSPGDYVLLNAEKSLQYVACYFGAHMAGLVNVVMDPGTAPAQIEAVCARIHPRLAVGWQSRRAWPCPVYDWAQVEMPGAVQPCAFPPAEAVADLMFTTGTTGEPKGVPLTIGNLAAAARNINSFIGNTGDDVELVALPLCHSFGMGRIRCQLLAGGTVVTVPNFGNERLLLETMQAQGVTGFAFVPAAWMYLKGQCGGAFWEAAQKLRYIEIGSAALPVQEKRLLAERLPRTRICMHYGLTEASRSAFMEFHADASRLESSGKASPDTEIRILSGNALLQAGEGEVCVRGDHVFNGYLGNDSSPFVEGFFRTGDMGRLDESGYLYLTGRIKELINTGGKKVSPQEVEELLCNHPDVCECACAGVPDEHGLLGEVVTAFIVPRPGVERIKLMAVRRFLQGKLEVYKLPMKVVMVNSLPKTESGKLQRRKLLDTV